MAEYSPMMQKYLETKKEYEDCVLFYRLGDFYEMFFDDAINVSRELELTLTGKDCGQEERAPMCGIPYHAADSYINRLVEKGYKVAICEQVEDPKTAKGLVKREVIKEDDVSDNKVLKEEAKTPVFFNDDDFKELEKPKEVVKSSYLKEKPVIKKEEKKIFKPTPIISPVYGVLDKNYHKEDITSKRQVSLSDTASLSIDDVRKKAYGTLEDDLENTMFGSNSILFNKETEKEENVLHSSSCL